MAELPADSREMAVTAEYCAGTPDRPITVSGHRSMGRDESQRLLRGFWRLWITWQEPPRRFQVSLQRPRFLY